MTRNEDVTRNIELELTEDLRRLDSYENVKVQISNYSEESNLVACLQVLYDCGIISGFYTKNDVPLNYYRHREGRPQISMTVPPPKCGQKIRWLKSIIILSSNDDKTFEFLPRIEIVNETKETKWTYSKHFIGIPEAENNIFWLTSWKFRGSELEAGDDISLKVLSVPDLCVRESGMELVYENEPDDDQCNSIDQLRWTSNCSSFLTGTFAYIFFKSQKNLYRMRRLVKE
ncbi:hypothetical protein PTKIN_Ptkin01aG0297200 [Pterospermum kingtungense]